VDRNIGSHREQKNTHKKKQKQRSITTMAYTTIVVAALVSVSLRRNGGLSRAVFGVLVMFRSALTITTIPKS
jgi:pheromone shutdown protein TraB